jgi:phosphoserine phosphatase
LKAETLFRRMAEASSSEPVLCVDLDGTLARGDSMVRLAWRLALAKPWLAPALAMWALKGRAAVKDEIARRAPFDPASLAYNRELLAWLRQEKARGRRLAIASGADRRVVAAVARHLALFDDVLASDGETSLTGRRKGAALAARYGAFDYIGNSRKDLPVWRRAAARYLVRDRPLVAAWLRRRVEFTRIFAADWHGGVSID